MVVIVIWLGGFGVKYEIELFFIGMIFNLVLGVYIFCKVVLIVGWWILFYVGEMNFFYDCFNVSKVIYDGYKCVI